MKSLLKSVLVVAALGLASCQSGNVSARNDYREPAFDPLKQKVEDRARVLRSLHPELSEADARARASQEFDYERAQDEKKQRQKSAQDKFEQDLAKSVEK